MDDSFQVACPHCGTVNRIPAAKTATKGRCGRCKAALFDGHPITMTEANAQAHLVQSDLPVLLDFWAPWCGPCRVMAPVFEEAAGILEPRLRLAKVNSDEEQRLAGRYGIRSIPTLVLVQRGREIARTSGAMPLNALLKWVNDYV